MRHIKQFAIITTFLLLGELTNKATGVPIPGSVFGMLYLLLALNFKIIKLKDIQEVSDFLLKNILFFFIPVGVSLMTSFELIKSDWWKILLIVFVSTFLVMSFTASIVQLLSKNKEKS